MNKSQQIKFIHKVVVLLEAGISLKDSLSIISNQETSKIKNVIQNIKTSIEKGNTFSKSFEINQIKLDRNLQSMIMLGESAGTLPSSIRLGLEAVTKSTEMKRKIIGALVYPAFIGMATLAMTLFLILFIFPKIMPLFLSMNIQLPFITRAILALYKTLIHHGFLLGFIALILFLGFIFIYKKSLYFKLHIQNTVLKFPILGELFKKYFLLDNCRSISTLLEYGQTLDKTLVHIAASSYFEIYRKCWEEIHNKFKTGMEFSILLKDQSKYFPTTLVDMVYIGEKSGTLSTMLAHIAHMYEEELDGFIKQIGIMIEPVLMIGMGLIVGSVALSIILPIYEITNHLQH